MHINCLNKRNIGDWMKIIFTGGGTAGHISLNLALIPHFIELGYEVHYIGSKNGMEKERSGKRNAGKAKAGLKRERIKRKR